MMSLFLHRAGSSFDIERGGLSITEYWISAFKTFKSHKLQKKIGTIVRQIKDNHTTKSPASTIFIVLPSSFNPWTINAQY